MSNIIKRYKNKEKIDVRLKSKIIQSGRAMLVMESLGRKQGLYWAGKGEVLHDMENAQWIACGCVVTESPSHEDVIAIHGDKFNAGKIAMQSLVNGLEVKDRITYALNSLQELEGPHFKVKIWELVLIAGCCREMAGRVLKILVNEGHIDRLGYSITVSKAAALRKAS